MLEKRRERESGISYRWECDGKSQREKEIVGPLCVCALLNQACNASFYWKASLDSCDKWQASLICT